MGRRAANDPALTTRNASHWRPTLTSAKPRTAATDAPTANGAKKNDPGVVNSPSANSTAHPTQIHCHVSV